MTQPMTRRAMLARCANGFGGVALTALMANSSFGDIVRSDDSHEEADALSPRTPHHRPRARSVIFLYMDGGPSQVDIFDPKPLLQKYGGQNPYDLFKVDQTQFNNVGTMLPSPWKFQRHGQAGTEVSELFPHIAKRVDDIAVVRSCVSKFAEHTNANYFLHTGIGLQGRPSVGAWFGYGLGSENQDLPGFVVLNGGLIPPGGLDCFGAGFLPAAYQGSVFKPGGSAVANITRSEKNDELQRNKFTLLQQLDAGVIDRLGQIDAIESSIMNYELAFRMQAAVPELMDVAGESEATKKLYGLDADHPQTRTFGMQCLLARRLVERGVRFIELTCPGGNGDRWDQHANLVDGHTKNCKTVDQPIAGLLRDLKEHGLLDETLVVWGGEFGRTPFAQGKDGRDHNPSAFSMFLAGGGVKGGVTHGTTDEFGYRVIDGKVEVHDIHATMLHLLGINHEKLTYRFSGRDFRLTDVHGRIVSEILA
jgi:hypothetical protein